MESKEGSKFAVRVCSGDGSDPPMPGQSRTAVRTGVKAKQTMTGSVALQCGLRPGRSMAGGLRARSCARCTGICSSHRCSFRV